jgi:predicted nucleic acid-binding protein
MLYFDTSFLAPLIREEPASTAVERFIARLPVGTLALSYWTRVEISSLLARDVRMGGMEGQAAREADALFDAVVKETFVTLLPDAADFNLAREYLGNHDTGLRSGDALHLAIARNNRAEAIYSLDNTMVKAGKILGLPLSRGIRHPK